MQTFTESNDFKSFVAVHGEAKAVELITAFCRGTETEFDIRDKMCDVLTTREGYDVEVIDGAIINNAPAPAVNMQVHRVGSHDVIVHFANKSGRVRATETASFMEGVTGLGTHGVFIGAEIVGRRDLEIETLPNGRLVAFVSRSRIDFEAIRDIVVLLQRIGGKPPRARAAPAVVASAATASTSSGDVRVFKCNVCGKVFKNACGLANHMRHKHKEVAAAATAALAAALTETDSA